MDSAEHTEQKKRSKAIYLLPNLFTTAGMFAGYYAIVASGKGNFTAASIAIIIAMLLDGVDGRVARMTNTQSEFGAQYDSLADLVSFGMAPALVMYNWALSGMHSMGPVWGKIGWLVAFFYTAMAALRLARFNVQIGKADKAFFTGLASPSAATLIASFIWLCTQLEISGTDKWMWLVSLILTVMAGALMVSPVRYWSFKVENREDKIPFMVLIGIVLIMILVILYPPGVFFAVFLGYSLSGPLMMMGKRGKSSGGSSGG
jgi:CDP-diacylglycerol--serine O-phosphatidyltransferase